MPEVPLIAIVDDDEVTLLLTDNALSTHGFATACFSSGAEFLAALKGLSGLRLILLDMEMPGMSGYELQCQLEEMGVRIPIIFLSGTVDMPLANSMLHHGAVEVLCKPLDVEVLMKIVNEVMGVRG